MSPEDERLIEQVLRVARTISDGMGRMIGQMDAVGITEALRPLVEAQQEVRLLQQEERQGQWREAKREQRRKARALVTDSVWADKWTLADKLSISTHTLKAWRESGKWIEGIHWQRLNSRTIRYHLPLCRDWVRCGGFTTEHQRAVEYYLTQLPSALPKSRGRK